MPSKTRRPAFSLVELVIVIVIIGVIAAIAVPRISRGARGASDSSVRGSLAALRNAIDLYAAEHGGNFPAQAGDGTNAAGSELAFLNQLTKFTDAAGAFSATKTATAIYGPYLRAGMPSITQQGRRQRGQGQDGQYRTGRQRRHG
jgi:prepilin-type N-terminal cleavage/methylation domain-containing protein